MLPFYESSVEDEEKAAGEAAEVRRALQSSAAGKDGQPLDEWNYLDNFFKRYNKVLLDVTAIERERDRLGGENGDLRSILKQYLDGISVSPPPCFPRRIALLPPQEGRLPIRHAASGQRRGPLRSEPAARRQFALCRRGGWAP